MEDDTAKGNGRAGRSETPASWEPPAPCLELVAACASDCLPAPVDLVDLHPTDGRLQGAMVPRRVLSGGTELPPGFDFRFLRSEGQMTPGSEYAVVTGGKGIFLVSVSSSDVLPHPAYIDEPRLWYAVKLDADLVDTFRKARFAVTIELQDAGDLPAEAVVFGMELADRLSALADATVYDFYANRFFRSGSWRYGHPGKGLDVTEHVMFHAEEDDSVWLHTHGLVKFGKPEFEIHDIPPGDLAVAMQAINLLSFYVVGEDAVIRPGDTIGNRDVPILALAGARDRDEHWKDIPVIELAGLDEFGGPHGSATMKAIDAFLGMS